MDNELHAAIVDEPDLRGPAVVVQGSVLSGFKFHGPFETIDAASEWYRTETISGLLGVGCCTIVLLETPDRGIVHG